jgi:autotransporter-associated beta strand protein
LLRLKFFNIAKSSEFLSGIPDASAARKSLLSGAFFTQNAAVVDEHSHMHRIIYRVSLLILISLASARAGSATWDLNPSSGGWNAATNWTPVTVPNGAADTATFGFSNIINVSISGDTKVNGISFTAAAANPYTITANPRVTLTFSGAGVINNSGVTQNFVSAVDGAGNFGQIFFTNNATAGTSNIFINKGSTASFVPGGETAFFNSSSAANATFVNKGGTTFGSGGGRTMFHDSSTAGNANFTNSAGLGTSTSATIFLDTSTAANGRFINSGGGSGGLPFAEGGQTLFFNTSTAANGTFVNNGATARGGFGGATSFDDNSTAGKATFVNNGGAASGVAAFGGGATFFFGTSTAANGTFINNAATASGAEGGVTQFGLSFFNFSPSAGNGTFINNGADVGGAVGGKTVFYNTSTASAATLIANGGTNGGGGGGIFFEEQSTGGTSRVEVFGNGFLDISEHSGPPPSLLKPSRVTMGSIEGDGNVFLGRNNLIVGSNNLSTTFSGVIRDGGASFGTADSLTKIGAGTLDLTGTNTYTGNTKIHKGVLQVDGCITSNTRVHESGTLAGSGTILGAVTNNGVVRPGDGGPGTLTVNGNYTQSRDGALLIDIAGANAGQVGLLDVLGNADLHGQLDPVLENGFIPAIGESFTFLDYGSHSGLLAIHHPNIAGTMEHWVVTYAPREAILTATAGAFLPDSGCTSLLATLSLLALAALRGMTTKYSKEQPS